MCVEAVLALVVLGGFGGAPASGQKVTIPKSFSTPKLCINLDCGRLPAGAYPKTGRSTKGPSEASAQSGPSGSDTFSISSINKIPCKLVPEKQIGIAKGT